MIGPDAQAAQIPTPAQLGYMAGIGYTQFPAAGFFFDGLGRPSAGQIIRVGIAGTAIPQIIVVEAETGYVHD